MEYLNHVLGIRTVYYDQELNELPNYILSSYKLRKVDLDGVEAVFAYPKENLDPAGTIKKQFDRIKNKYKVSAVLIADKLTYREKEYLLRYQIPFVVEGKQIYLPFMGMYLQKRSDSEKQETSAILPSAQLLLLYFIYQGCNELQASTISRGLDLTSMSISRAARQLKELGLIELRKKGVNIIISSDKRPKELFSYAEDFLLNPIKKKMYIPKDKIDKELLKSGISALAEYTMISPSSVACYASDSVSKWEKDSTKTIQDISDQCEIELWRYDPKKLSNGKYVDRLSLALALKNDNDERTEKAIEEMLDQLWREIDGKRH